MEPDALQLASLTAAAAPLPDLPEPADRRTIRESAGVSLMVAAAAIGTTISTLSRWERGLTAPRLSARRAYLKLLSALSALAAPSSNG